MKPTPAQHRALTIAAVALGSLAATWTPGIVTPITAAVLTYLTVIGGTAWARHWDISQTLTATTLHLRAGTAAALRWTAITLQSLAAWALWLLTTALAAVSPATPADANINA